MPQNSPEGVMAGGKLRLCTQHLSIAAAQVHLMPCDAITHTWWQRLIHAVCWCMLQKERHVLKLPLGTTCLRLLLPSTLPALAWSLATLPWPLPAGLLLLLLLWCWWGRLAPRAAAAALATMVPASPCLWPLQAQGRLLLLLLHASLQVASIAGWRWGRRDLPLPLLLQHLLPL